MDEAKKIQAQKEKELKNSQLLTEAIKKLSEQFIRAGNEGRKKNTDGILKGGLKNHFAPAMAMARQLTTPAGILDVLSAKAGGGLLSSVLGTASSTLREKAEQRQKKTQWGADFLTGTDRGRELTKKHGLEKASSIAGKYYDTKTKLEEEIGAQEERRNSLKKSGIKGADLAQDELEALAKKKRQLSYVMGERDRSESSAPKKKSRRITPDSPGSNTGNMDDTNRDLPSNNETQINQEDAEPKRDEALIDSILNSKLKDIQEQYPEESKSPEFMREVKDGIQEELLSLSKEQLKQLKILAENASEPGEPKEESDSSRVERFSDNIESLTNTLESDSSRVERFSDTRETDSRNIESLTDELFRSQTTNIQDQYPEESKSPGFMKDVKDSIQEELLALNEEQVDQLKILVRNSIVSEEDKFEENRGKKIAIEGEKLLPKKEDKKGGLMDMALSMLPGAKTLARIGPMLARVVPLLGAAAGAVAAAAGPVLAVVGTAVAAYKAGGLLNELVLNPAAAAITGDKDATVGTAVYDGVDKLKGVFGMETDSDKMKRAENEAALALGKKKLAAGEKISESLAATLKAAGVSVPANMIRVPGKPDTPSAVKTTKDMAVKEEVLDQTKLEKASEGTVSQKTNNTSIMNASSTTIMAARPELRTKDPTINRLLERNFG